MLTTTAAIFSTLLVVTGLVKLRRPRDTARALGRIGLPFPFATTVGLAATEVVVGIWAIGTRDPALFIIQALIYLSFAVWVLIALRREVPLATCGCLGRDDTPPYWGHLVVNVLAVASSAGAASTPAPELPGTAVGLVATLGIVSVGTWLAWTILSDGARSSALMTQ